MNTLFRHICLWLTLIALGAGASAVSAKPLGVSVIDNRSGLSSSSVKAVIQDNMGLMWFGTKNGLNRYDGVTMKTYRVFDEAANRGNNNVSALYQDPSGTIWVGTDRGIYLFDPRHETFTLLAPKSADGVSPDDWVSQIYPDADSNHWALIPNQGAFRFYNDKVDFYPITDHNGNKERIPLVLMVSNVGKVYVGTSRDGIYTYEKTNNSFRPVGHGRPDFANLRGQSVSQFIDNGQELMIILNDGKVLSMDIAEESLTPINIPFGQEVFMRTAAIVDNELCLGTTQGLWIYNLTTHQLSHLYNSTSRSNRISDNTVNTIGIDSDKNIWVGTMYGGVNHIRRQGLVFEDFSRDDRLFQLSSDRVRGMCTDSQGRIWIGTEENGLNLYDPATNLVTRPIAPDAHHRICLSLLNDGPPRLRRLQPGGHRRDRRHIGDRQLRQQPPARLHERLRRAHRQPWGYLDLGRLGCVLSRAGQLRIQHRERDGDGLGDGYDRRFETHRLVCLHGQRHMALRHTLIYLPPLSLRRKPYQRPALQLRLGRDGRFEGESLVFYRARRPGKIRPRLR